MKNLILILSITFAGALNVNAKVISVHNPKNIVSQQDDTQALQAYFDKTDVVNLPAGKTFNISGTIYVHRSNQIINGNLATINYSGNDAAIDFQRVNGKFYASRVTIQDISINLQSPGAVGIRWQASYSQLKNCSIFMPAQNETGVQLCGDGLSGSGSYYDLFEDCFVQGARQKGQTGQYGWKFTYDKGEASRCPNTNMWIGGRVGQCDVGMYINGAGNVVDHITTEGCGICFYFDNADSKVGCVSNKVMYPYIERCQTAFRFGPNSIACVASNPYITSTPSVKEDLGSKNLFNQ